MNVPQPHELPRQYQLHQQASPRRLENQSWLSSCQASLDPRPPAVHTHKGHCSVAILVYNEEMCCVHLFMMGLPNLWKTFGYLKHPDSFCQHGSQAASGVKTRTILYSRKDTHTHTLKPRVLQMLLMLLTTTGISHPRSGNTNIVRLGLERIICSYPDNNDDLALSEAHTHSWGQRVLGRFICGDDLQQLHLIHWWEVVHANHLRVTSSH